MMMVGGRACGGLVSWSSTLGVGASYQDSDRSIDYQVIDRPCTPATMFPERLYVQPQWIFDSLNAGEQLPPDKYFPGCKLPPHTSPFRQIDSKNYISADEVGTKGPEVNLDTGTEVHNEKIDDEDYEEQDEDQQSARTKKPRSRARKKNKQVRFTKTITQNS